MARKLCCPRCFQDHLLIRQAEDFAATRDNEAICPYCKSSGRVFEPQLLKPKFEELLDTYQEVTELGKDLHLLLQDDWELFRDRETAESLVYEILPEAKGKSYTGCKPAVDYLSKWNALKEEVKNRYRYCFSRDILPLDEKEGNPITLVLQELYTKLEKGKKDGKWFRARISEEKLRANDMGAPPCSKASAGRANPVGIPHLYLAEDEKTAVTEVRPHKGATVYLATFEVVDELSCIDLTNPVRRISPFGLELSIEEVKDVLSFLKAASEDLSQPVSPDVAATTYIPTQILCEFIKKLGYAGVIYKSSYTEGRNLVIFNVNDALKPKGRLKACRIIDFSVSHYPIGRNKKMKK